MGVFCMKFYTFCKLFRSIAVSCIVFIVTGCISESDDSIIMPRDNTVINTSKQLDMDGITDDTIKDKYPNKFSKFVKYSVDRSYINAVDYPMSMEAYYASRFTNKKDDVKKPAYSVSPIDLKMNDVYIDDVIERIKDAGDNLDLIKDELLVIRKKYIEILSLSRYCCSHGMTLKLENIGIDKDYIFKFMIDDKRLYELQNICMIINDNDIANLLGSIELSVIVRDVRDSCVCKNKESLSRHLELFKAIVGKTDLFKRHNIIYKYKNEIGEVVKNSIGRDMINLLNTLESCP